MILFTKYTPPMNSNIVQKIVVFHISDKFTIWSVTMCRGKLIENIVSQSICLHFLTKLMFFSYFVTIFYQTLRSAQSKPKLTKHWAVETTS